MRQRQLGRERILHFFLLALLLPMLLSHCVEAGAQNRDKIQLAGDVLALVLPATAGGIALDRRDWQGERQLAESAALTFAATYGLKYGIDETRPNGGHYSFPSGHSSVSFFSAEFLRRRYGWKFGLPAYAAAAFVGYSRVESNQHYTRDVVAGAGIGALSSFLFTRPYKGKGWRVVPVSSSQAGTIYGISVSRQW